MAASSLANLPSRGNFVDENCNLSLSESPVYICHHDTQAPEHQRIRTDPTNILIRGLKMKKAADAQANAKGKRQGESPDTDRASKKPAKGGKSVKASELHNYTVENLKSLLREHGLPVGGKKDDLINRLKTVL